MRTAPAAVLTAIALTSCTGSPSAPVADPGTGSSDSAGPAEPSDVATPPARSVTCPPHEQRRVVGKRHAIVGEVFGRPLTSPPSPDHQNKILWSARRARLGDMIISATLNGSEVHVRRRVQGGPGPSIINVPKPGCWTFSLRWNGGHDVAAVRYTRPS